jgi:hypothetical protein
MHLKVKGTVPRDFRLQVFCEPVSPKPLIIPLVANLLPVSFNLLPVSRTPRVPVGKFTANVVDTSAQFATGVVDTGGAP